MIKADPLRPIGTSNPCLDISIRLGLDYALVLNLASYQLKRNGLCRQSEKFSPSQVLTRDEVEAIQTVAEITTLYQSGVLALIHQHVIGPYMTKEKMHIEEQLGEVTTQHPLRKRLRPILEAMKENKP